MSWEGPSRADKASSFRGHCCNVIVGGVEQADGRKAEYVPRRRARFRIQENPNPNSHNLAKVKLRP